MVMFANSAGRPPNKVLPQIFSATSCFIGQFSIGLTLGWISPALFKLQGEDSPIPTTASEGSNIASFMVVGGVIAPILYALKVDWIGRRWIAFLGSISFSVAWLFIILSTEVYHVYLSRVFVGFGVGYTFGLVPTYVGEITETHLRSLFGVAASILMALGIIFEFAVGPYVDYYLLGYLSLIFPVLMFISAFWMIESPYYLMRQGKEDEARTAVMKLRGQSDSKHVEAEMEVIKTFVENSPKRPFNEIMKEVMLPGNKKAIIILTVLMLGQQFNGNSTVKAYFHIILKDTESPLNPEFIVLGSEVAGLCILISSMFCIERYGRRPLFLITCVGCLLSSFVTGLYFMLWSEEVVGIETSWLAIVGLLGIQFFSSVGSSAIPAIIASEMSTASIRSWFGGYKAITLSVFNSISVKLFQVIKDDLGGQYAFWMFTIMMILVSTTVYFILPETKGKTLQEIQDILSGSSKRKSINDLEGREDKKY